MINKNKKQNYISWKVCIYLPEWEYNLIFLICPLCFYHPVQSLVSLSCNICPHFLPDFYFFRTNCQCAWPIDTQSSWHICWHCDKCHALHYLDQLWRTWESQQSILRILFCWFWIVLLRVLVASLTSTFLTFRILSFFCKINVHFPCFTTKPWGMQPFVFICK